MPPDNLVIKHLQANDQFTIDLVKKRQSKIWLTTEQKIQTDWITTALSTAHFPFIFIAKINQQFIGQIFLSIRKNSYLGIKTQPWISALYVKKSHRNQGIGQALINHCTTIAKQHKYSHLYLDTVSVQSYYNHIGNWEIIGTDIWKPANEKITILKTKL